MFDITDCLDTIEWEPFIEDEKAWDDIIDLHPIASTSPCWAYSTSNLSPFSQILLSGISSSSLPQRNLHSPIKSLQKEAYDPQIVITNLKFLQDFKNEYLKTRIGKGNHHLRCFPTCRERGHVDRGFCGEMMKIELTIEYKAHPEHSEPDLKEILHMVGEFQSLDSFNPKREFRTSLQMYQLLQQSNKYFIAKKEILTNERIHVDSRTQIETIQCKMLLSFVSLPWNFPSDFIKSKSQKYFVFVFSIYYEKLFDNHEIHCMNIGTFATKEFRVTNQNNPKLKLKEQERIMESF